MFTLPKGFDLGYETLHFGGGGGKEEGENCIKQLLHKSRV